MCSSSPLPPHVTSHRIERFTGLDEEAPIVDFCASHASFPPSVINQCVENGEVVALVLCVEIVCTEGMLLVIAAW